MLAQGWEDLEAIIPRHKKGRFFNDGLFEKKVVSNCLIQPLWKAEDGEPLTPSHIGRRKASSPVDGLDALLGPYIRRSAAPNDSDLRWTPPRHAHRCRSAGIIICAYEEDADSKVLFISYHYTEANLLLAPLLHSAGQGSPE